MANYGWIIGLCVVIIIVIIIVAVLGSLIIIKRRQKRFDKICEILREMNMSTEEIIGFKEEIDEFLIPNGKLHINFDHILGEGQTSTVYKGHLIGPSPLHVTTKSLETRRFVECDVAAKMAKNFGQDEATYLFQEIQAMKKMGYHESIMCMLGWSMLNDVPCLVFEIAKEDLLNFVRGFRNCLQDQVPYKVFISILWQVTRGMQYVVSKGMIHRDLAARNILLFDNYRAKISDFGLCCTQNDNFTYQASIVKKLPMKWLSLEALIDRRFSEKSDIWSFGILAYEVFAFGRVPYFTMNHDEMLEFLQSGQRLDKPEGTPSEIYDLMKCCWEEDPDKRQNFSVLDDILYKFLEKNYGSEDYLI